MDEPAKVAIVTEAMTQPGGGDRFLESVIKNFSQADIYTPLFNKQAYQNNNWEFLKSKYTIHTFLTKKTRLINNPSRKNTRKWLLRIYNIIAPIVYESLNLDKYDLVISISSKFAKGVITDTNTKHVNICLTPSGYDWNFDRRKLIMESKSKISRFFSNLLSHFFRIWDVQATSRADENYSISKYISRQVKKFYSIDSEILYPAIKDFWLTSEQKDNPVGVETNSLQKSNGLIQDQVTDGGGSKYFLVVSRLYDYKRVDLAIKACKKIGESLIIIGEGPERNNLKKLAGDYDKIKFLGYQSDQKVKKLYINAKALLFCGEEDFGLTPIEAMAQGTPVIGYNKGGVKETVIEGETGELFDDYNGLLKILKDFNKSTYKKSQIIAQAKNFNQDSFNKKFRNLILS